MYRLVGSSLHLFFISPPCRLSEKRPSRPAVSLIFVSLMSSLSVSHLHLLGLSLSELYLLYVLFTTLSFLPSFLPCPTIHLPILCFFHQSIHPSILSSMHPLFIHVFLVMHTSFLPYIHSFIYPSISSMINPSTFLNILLFIQPSSHPSIYPCYTSIHPSFLPSIHSSFLSIHPSFLCIYPPTHPSIYPFYLAIHSSNQPTIHSFLHPLLPLMLSGMFSCAAAALYFSHDPRNGVHFSTGVTSIH